jgi:hypothetical protein
MRGGGENEVLLHTYWYAKNNTGRRLIAFASSFDIIRVRRLNYETGEKNTFASPPYHNGMDAT